MYLIINFLPKLLKKYIFNKNYNLNEENKSYLSLRFQNDCIKYIFILYYARIYILYL